MKPVAFLSAACISLVLASCSSDTQVKKVTIMANGKMTMDESRQKINLEPGNTHTEEELVFMTGDKVTLSVTTPEGVKTFDINDNGMHLLNLKTDTLVGGVVNYSAGDRTTAISGQDLERMIDSTRQLLEGKNASDDKKTYFLAPFNAKKISSDPNVKIIGPYKGIPYKVEADKSGKAIEIYKFFTNKQKRETLDDMMKRFNR
jgi:hypothetical protein